MPASGPIELPTGQSIAILYEDRSALAIDKPRGWMLAPSTWQKTSRNLQSALSASISAGDFWARSRGLKYLRFVHRLDAGTSGVLLAAKSQGAVRGYSQLFQSRRMIKVYLAVVHGKPRQPAWTCRVKLGRDARQPERVIADARQGKPAETHFRVLRIGPSAALVEARPLTGRTHQIRVHLAQAGLPILGDDLYGRRDETHLNLALRSAALAYEDPFSGRPVEIRAPMDAFGKEYGFDLSNYLVKLD